MRWPFSRRRAHDAEQQLERAEEVLADVERQWPQVHAVTSETRYHRQLNGWTSTVKTIFSG